MAYLGDGVLMIGCGERTNRLTINALVKTNLFCRVVVVHVPPPPAHAMTCISTPFSRQSVTVIDRYDVRQAPHQLLSRPNLTFCDAEVEETSVTEQRVCR